jgi:hypothetical protein
VEYGHLVSTVMLMDCFGRSSMAPWKRWMLTPGVGVFSVLKTYSGSDLENQQRKGRRVRWAGVGRHDGGAAEEEK